MDLADDTSSAPGDPAPPPPFAMTQPNEDGREAARVDVVEAWRRRRNPDRLLCPNCATRNLRFREPPAGVAGGCLSLVAVGLVVVAIAAGVIGWLGDLGGVGYVTGSVVGVTFGLALLLFVLGRALSRPDGYTCHNCFYRYP